MRSLAADSRQTHTYCFVDQHSRNRHIRAAIAAGGRQVRHDGLLVAPRRTLRWRNGLRLRGHRGLRTCPSGFGPSHGRPSLPGRRNDPRPPLGAKAALLLAGLRWRWRRRCSSFGLSGSRPSFPLSGSYAPARRGAQDALGCGGRGRSGRRTHESLEDVGHTGFDLLAFLLVADQCGGEYVGVKWEWHKQRLYAQVALAARVSRRDRVNACRN